MFIYVSNDVICAVSEEDDKVVLTLQTTKILEQKQQQTPYRQTNKTKQKSTLIQNSAFTRIGLQIIDLLFDFDCLLYPKKLLPVTKVRNRT